MIAKILIAEDEANIRIGLVATLESEGYAVTAAVDGAQALKLFAQEKFDLVVLDVMMPKASGYDVCRELRARGARVPVLFLTAKGEEIDKVVGFKLGADDYVTKPFNSRELVARIKALLRRASYGAVRTDRQETLCFAGWRIDPMRRQVRDPDGVHVTMTTAEFDVLLAFCRNPGMVLTREQLLGLTHAGLAGPVERSIDVHVSRIRQKIEPNVREPSFIKTVRLGGYLFTPDVEPV